VGQADSGIRQHIVFPEPWRTAPAAWGWSGPVGASEARNPSPRSCPRVEGVEHSPQAPSRSATDRRPGMEGQALTVFDRLGSISRSTTVQPLTRGRTRPGRIVTWHFGREDERLSSDLSNPCTRLGEEWGNMAICRRIAHETHFHCCFAPFRVLVVIPIRPAGRRARCRMRPTPCHCSPIWRCCGGQRAQPGTTLNLADHRYHFSFGPSAFLLCFSF